MTLYTVRRIPETFEVKKYDDDLNHLKTYTTSDQGCSCPAGHNSSCRHRDMLKLFIAQGLVDKGWFCDYDRVMWHVPGIEVVSLEDPGELHDAIARAVGE